MGQPLSITTSKFNKNGKVEVDGHVWSVNLPGAGTEMMLSQAQRRMQVLDRKIEAGTATDEDLDKYDTYEKTIYNAFLNLFKDETDDNSEVAEWVEQTPFAVMILAFEELKGQAHGPAKPTSST